MATRSNRYSLLLEVCFFTLVFLFFCVLTYRQIEPPPNEALTTLNLQVYFAKALGTGAETVYLPQTNQRIPLYLPHQGFYQALIAARRVSHLSFATSATLLLAALATSSAIIIYMILRNLVPNHSSLFLLSMTAVLLTVSAIYLPFFNPQIFFGQGSPNVWHNSTAISLKPFALMSAYLLISIFQENRYRSSMTVGTIAV